MNNATRKSRDMWHGEKEAGDMRPPSSTSKKKKKNHGARTSIRIYRDTVIMASITEIVISREERRVETAPLSLEEVELRPPPEGFWLEAPGAVSPDV